MVSRILDPPTLAHEYVHVCKTWDAADADRGVARVNRAMRARELLAHTYGPILDRFTFSILVLYTAAVNLVPAKGVLLNIDQRSMCQKLARALRDLLARYRNPHLQRPTLLMQKSVCQNLVMVRSYGPRSIFLPALFVWIVQIWPYPNQNPM